MCFGTGESQCETISMFAIERAEPSFYILSDGYMGLGIDTAYGGKPNVLD